MTAGTDDRTYMVQRFYDWDIEKMERKGWEVCRSQDGRIMAVDCGSGANVYMRKPLPHEA